MKHNNKKTNNKTEFISLELGTTFEEFKRKFYTSFPDLKIFDLKDINLTKVILDGLKVNYLSKGINNDLIFKPFVFIILKFLYWKLRHFRYKKNILVFIQRKILIIDEGKLSQKEDGSKVSYYFENITEQLEKDKYFIISINKIIINKNNSIHYTDVVKWALSVFPSIQDFQFIFNLKKFYKNIKKQKLFSDVDLINIKMAFNSFFFQYYTYMKLFKHCKFQKVLFTQHYHNEGLILACKKNDIYTIELQHGLISTKDIFYVFPKNFEEVRTRALMPDEIWCFGQYWKDTLLSGYEWNESQIKIFGNYVYRNASVKNNESISYIPSNQKYILITTQTFLHSYYIQYVKNLIQYLHQQNIKDIKIVVKIHPSEKLENYTELKQYSSVLLVTDNLDYWLKNCQYNITIYSTTVFDAMLYDKFSYCLYYEEFKDYLEEYATLSFVKIIKPDDFSFLHQHSTTSININKKYYYTNIQYQLLNTLI